VNSGGQPEKLKKKEADLAVLVTHGACGGGIVVAMDSSGSRRRSFFFSLLLRCAIFFRCFLFHLSTMFFPLCSGFVAVLLVTTKRKNGGTGKAFQTTFLRLFSFLFFFVFLLLPISVSSSSVSFGGSSLGGIGIDGGVVVLL
jgi:hypothetical protein